MQISTIQSYTANEYNTPTAVLLPVYDNRAFCSAYNFIFLLLSALYSIGTYVFPALSLRVEKSISDVLFFFY